MKLLFLFTLAVSAWAITPAQYVAQGCGVLIDWNMPTFYNGGAEVAAADINPDTFAPTGLNIDHWLDAAVAAGCTYAILNTKHHDGFLLWPSAYAHPLATNPAKRVPYTIAQTTWFANNGSPDVVGLFVTKARARGLGIGLYFSIWDLTFQARSGKTAFTDASSYISMIETELSELLSNYGPLTAIWTDGWVWATGELGGYTNIPFATINNFVKGIQPDCLLIDNRSTVSGVRTFEGSLVAPGNMQMAETVKSIRLDGHWFYHASDDPGALETNAQLKADIAFNNANSASYLIGIMPGPDGDLSGQQSITLSGHAAQIAGASSLGSKGSFQ